jgi:MFS family permease
MVEIFEESCMTFNPSWATIIVRMVEIFSEFKRKLLFLKTPLKKIILKTILIWLLNSSNSHKLLGTGLTLYLSDKLGRKILLLVSGFGMSAAMVLLATSFILTCDVDDESAYFSLLSLLPLFGMCLFFFAYAIGFNSVLLIFLGEIYSPGNRMSLNKLFALMDQFQTNIPLVFVS